MEVDGFGHAKKGLVAFLIYILRSDPQELLWD